MMLSEEYQFASNLFLRRVIITDSERRIVAVEENLAGCLAGTRCSSYEVWTERNRCYSRRGNIEAITCGVHQVTCGDRLAAIVWLEGIAILSNTSYLIIADADSDSWIRGKGDGLSVKFRRSCRIGILGCPVTTQVELIVCRSWESDKG